MGKMQVPLGSGPPTSFNIVQHRNIPELDGLRGILSWWVVVCHVLQCAGYNQSNLGRGFRILVHGDYAVEVFIILSGFVIHKLWQDKREPSRTFITRRFLRLWPSYMVCLVGALALRPCMAIALAHPLGGDPNLTTQNNELWNNERMYLGAHFFAHLPMLHAAIPETILPSSSIAILSPAWSISLEWQFYLVAIPLFWSLHRWKERAWICFACIAGIGWMFRYSPPFSDWFPMRAFLSQKLLLFGIGIASHELWRALYGRSENVGPAIIWIAGAVLALTLSLPFAIWVFVFATIQMPSSYSAKFLNSTLVQFLGRVSYSTYLGHMLVVYLIQSVLFNIYPTIGKQAMLGSLAVLGTPLIVLLSVTLYSCVEKPAIDLGRRLRTQ